MKRVRFFILLLGFFTVVAAPAQQVDSLWKVISGLQSKDTVTLKKKKHELSNLFGLVLHGKAEEALRVTDTLAETCRLLGDSMAYYEALYRNKASIFQNTANYRKIFQYLSLYTHSLTRTGNANGYAYIDVGNLYYSFLLHEVALAYYQKAGEIFRNNQNYSGLATVMDNIALIWRDKKNLDSSLYYYGQSIRLRRDKLQDKYLVAYTEMREGGAVTMLKNEDAALPYFYRSKSVLSSEAFRHYKDFVTLRDAEIVCSRFLSGYHIGKNNIDSASWYLHYADSLTAAYSDLRQVPHNSILRGRILIAEKNYDAAMRELMIADSLVHEQQDGWTLLDVYDQRAKCLEEKGDWKGAVMLQHERRMVSDSLSQIINDDQLLMVNNALLQFENETQLAQNAADIREQHQYNRILVFGLSALALVLLLIALLLLRLRNKNRIIRRVNEDLQQANTAKEKMISVISHDLRSPFNTLIGLSDILADDVKNKRDAGDSVKLIREASRKAYVMLDNLMQWVSLQKENIVVNKSAIQTQVLMDELERLFRLQALAASIVLERKILVDEFVSDENMVMVILRNLVSNAIRHSNQGGKITVSFEGDGKNLLIEVSDNGPGIEEAELKQMFVRRPGIHVARKAGGMGLELVQEFITRLGGTIRAENKAEGGARFIVCLTSALTIEADADYKKTKVVLLELNLAEKAQLSGLLSELEQCEIFETSKLKKILQSVELSSPALIKWKAQIHEAISRVDENMFRQLIQLAR